MAGQASPAPARATEQRPRGAAGWAATAFNIKPEEIGRTLTLFAALVCIACIFWLGRTARGPLFNYAPGWGSDALPFMFILYGVCSSPVAIFFGRIAGRFRRERLFVGYLALSAVVNVVLYVLLAEKVHWAYAAYYVWCDLGVNLMFVQFWMLANDYHTSREAKRLYGLIGVGAVSGMLLGGLGGKASLAILGPPERLIFPVLVLTAILAFLVLRIARTYKKAPPPPAPRHAADGKAPSGYVAILSVVLFLAFTVAQIVDFQWQSLAKLRFTQAAFGSYMALYTAGVGAIAILIQLFLTRAVLTRAGVFVGMLFMPVTLGLGSIWLLAGPHVVGGAVPLVILVGASCMKFGDWGFSTTINDATYQILYFPFPAQKKAGIRLIIDGAARPLGYTSGGLVLLAIRHHLAIQEDSIIALCVIALWIGLAVVARRAYVKTLAATLVTRTTADHEEGPPDAAERKLLFAALDGGDPLRMRYAAERLLESPPEDVPPIIERLLAHGDAEVRRRALEAASGGAPAPVATLRRLVDEDPSDEVRGAALLALGAADPEGSLDALVARLDDQDPVVRRAALAALVRYGSLDGILAAGGTLQGLLHSEDARERADAADVLRRVGKTDFYRPIAMLLADRDKYVRRAACQAAATLRHPRLIDPLLAAAGLPGSRGASAHALGAFGAAAIDPVAVALAGATLRDYDREARRRLAWTFGRIADPRAHETSIALAERETDRRVRYALYKSAVRVRAHLGLPPLAERRVLGLLELELVELYELDAGRAAALERWGELPLLDAALAETLVGTRRRVLRLLCLAHEPPTLALIDHGLMTGNPAVVNNALEVLDNVLSPHEKRIVMPMAESQTGEGSAAERAERVKEALPVDPPGDVGLLARLAGGADPWLATCALAVVKRHRIAQLTGVVEHALAHADPLVRAAAAEARVALTGGGSATDAGAQPMYTMTEKILLLKGIGLFQHVPGDDLVPLAYSAEVESVLAGTAVMKEGEIGDALYIVVRGAMRVEAGGKEVAHIGPGECFGEMSIFDHQPRSATVIAAEPSEILKIDREDFQEVLSDHPAIADGVLRVLSARLRAATEKARAPKREG